MQLWVTPHGTAEFRLKVLALNFALVLIPGSPNFLAKGPYQIFGVVLKARKKCQFKIEINTLEMNLD